VFPTSQVAWKVGDCVLAPWEPNFLYVSKIAQVDGVKDSIEFEDGDAGWVQLDQIRTLALKRRLKVLCRQRMSPTIARPRSWTSRATRSTSGFKTRATKGRA
jgi:hypothetical protein